MLDRDFKITKAEEGAAFAVYVVPKCAKNEVVGKHGDALKVRLISTSVSGNANEILLDFLAEKLEVERESVEVAAGESSAEKMVVVLGVAPIEVERSLLS